MLISVTSSKKNVPPDAASSSPRRATSAPVKAPFSCPNSSDSSRWSGSAAQLMAMNGRSERRLFMWMARAISSLPVPDSPEMNTLASVGATRETTENTFWMDSLVPTMFSKLYCFFSWSRSTALSRTSLTCCAARPMRMRSCVAVKGLGM